ncbi:hypothetical protein BGX28_003045 [Mortierella sp. GBA30]|nr:hypothetical protein BGX28_003045 [Mortierella sp. GBA30]
MPLRTHHRPLFLERPLRGWIINYTAIIEPCNRTLHTSAHCLGFLSQEHLYLVPSPKARKPPNRIQKKPPLESDQYEDLDVDGSVSSLAATATAAGTGGSSVTMDFHIFWRGSVTDKLALSVHAFLFTQPLERARLHLWIDSTDLAGGVAEDYTQNQYARDLVSEPLNRFIRFHQWNQTAQEAFAYPTPPPARLRSEDASDQHLQQDQGQIQQQENQTIQKPSVAPVALSDEARFLILYRYGGMYLDADVLLLRDMSPFYDSGKEFAYEWSSTQMYNTAVLRLKRGSGVARRILDRAKAKEKKFQEKQQRMKQREARLAHGTHGKRYSEESNSVNKHPITGPRSEKVHADWREDSFNIQLDKESPPALQPVPTSLELPIQPGSSPLAPASHFPVIEKEGEEDTLGHQHHDSLFASSPPSSLPISPIIQRRLIKRGEMRPDEIYHPARLRSYLRPQDGLLDNNGLTMMPVSIFDPLWLRVDGAEPMVGLQNDSERMMVNLKTFPDVFTRTGTVCPLQQDMQEALGPAGREGGFTAGPEVFFMGAYAYHWHNSWLTPIDPHSWMGLMKQAYEEFLAGERPNLYGEWFRGDSVAIFKA